VRPLVEHVQSIAHDAARELERGSRTFADLLSGSVDHGVYVGLLVQLLNVEELIGSLVSRLPEALAMTTYAPPTPREQDARPFDLIATDLGSLWNCSQETALARASSIEWLPPVRFFQGTIETLLVHYPWALPSIAIVQDEWAASARPSATAIARRRPWPEASRAVRYLASQTRRAEQIGALDLLGSVRRADEKAVLSAAQSAVDMLTFLFAHLDECT
jgi:hypothetical protein